MSTHVRNLEILYGGSWWSTPWIILHREQGLVQVMEPGMTDWDAVFRNRRLAPPASIRLLAGGRARLNFADGWSLLLPEGPLDVTLSESPTTTIDMSRVWNLRLGRTANNILKFFGKQYRFEITHPGGSIGARG